MGIAKRAGVIAGAIIAFYLIDSYIGSLVREPAEISELREQGEQSTAERFVTKPLGEMLPVREDIGTDVRISEPSKIRLNAAGFVEGIQQTFVKGPSYETTTITASVYRLESDENASTHSSNIISSLKTGEDFKEISIRSIAAKCYGTYQALTFKDRATFYCAEDDVYFTVKATGLINIDNDAGDFAQIIASKISSGD